MHFSPNKCPHFSDTKRWLSEVVQGMKQMVQVVDASCDDETMISCFGDSMRDLLAGFTSSNKLEESALGGGKSRSAKDRERRIVPGKCRGVSAMKTHQHQTACYQPRRSASLVYGLSTLQYGNSTCFINSC